eukprot:TRINITY_DN25279_c0_g2_i1.p1 TRINITY_DN25279_c0_g2~~TRINITY_DN25279_c0_g2_i1.p1  ORF type:complete len:757 (-),score=141.73 TRINITY_DN25279_c0_g2_i1:49-2319(-)
MARTPLLSIWLLGLAFPSETRRAPAVRTFADSISASNESGTSQCIVEGPSGSGFRFSFPVSERGCRVDCIGSVFQDLDAIIGKEFQKSVEPTWDNGCSCQDKNTKEEKVKLHLPQNKCKGDDAKQRCWDVYLLLTKIAMTVNRWSVIDIENSCLPCSDSPETVAAARCTRLKMPLNFDRQNMGKLAAAAQSGMGDAQKMIDAYKANGGDVANLKPSGKDHLHMLGDDGMYEDEGIEDPKLAALHARPHPSRLRPTFADEQEDPDSVDEDGLALEDEDDSPGYEDPKLDSVNGPLRRPDRPPADGYESDDEADLSGDEELDSEDEGYDAKLASLNGPRIRPHRPIFDPWEDDMPGHYMPGYDPKRDALNGPRIPPSKPSRPSSPEDDGYESGDEAGFRPSRPQADPSESEDEDGTPGKPPQVNVPEDDIEEENLPTDDTAGKPGGAKPSEGKKPTKPEKPAAGGSGATILWPARFKCRDYDSELCGQRFAMMGGTRKALRRMCKPSKDQRPKKRKWGPRGDMIRGSATCSVHRNLAIIGKLTRKEMARQYAGGYSLKDGNILPGCCPLTCGQCTPGDPAEPEAEDDVEDNEQHEDGPETDSEGEEEDSGDNHSAPMLWPEGFVCRDFDEEGCDTRAAILGLRQMCRPSKKQRRKTYGPRGKPMHWGQCHVPNAQKKVVTLDIKARGYAGGWMRQDGSGIVPGCCPATCGQCQPPAREEQASTTTAKPIWRPVNDPLAERQATAPGHLAHYAAGHSKL